MDCRDTVLQQGCIMITLVLNDGSSGQDGLGTTIVMCQTVSKKLESLEVLAHSNVKQPNRCQNFRVLRGEFQSFNIYLNSTFVVLLNLVHPA